MMEAVNIRTSKNFLPFFFDHCLGDGLALLDASTYEFVVGLEFLETIQLRTLILLQVKVDLVA